MKDYLFFAGKESFPRNAVAVIFKYQNKQSISYTIKVIDY
jgi:hypothetical protein